MVYAGLHQSVLCVMACGVHVTLGQLGSERRSVCIIVHLESLPHTATSLDHCNCLIQSIDVIKSALLP